MRNTWQEKIRYEWGKREENNYDENVRKKYLKKEKHKYVQYGDIDEKNKSLQSCNFMRCPRPYSNWFHPPQSGMQFLLQDCHALRDPAPSTGWFFHRIDQACRINTYPCSCLQLFKATKCSILQTLLTSLHAPCHALRRSSATKRCKCNDLPKSSPHSIGPQNHKSARTLTIGCIFYDNLSKRDPAS